MSAKMFLRGCAVAGATALIAVAGPAWATGTYSISAGSTTSGDVPYTASTTGATPQIDFHTAFVNMSCDAGTAAGFLHLGSNVPGDNIASIDSTTWTNCLSFGLPMTVTQLSPNTPATPWILNATGVPTSGVTAGTVTDVKAHVAHTPVNPNDPSLCSFDVSGSVDGNFNANNQSLNITSPTAGATLVISNIVGCFGQLVDQEEAFFEASYAISNDEGPVSIVQP